MKPVEVAALALIGLSIAVTPAFATPLSLKATQDDFTDLIKVVKKKDKKKRQNYNSGNSYIPGYVLTPYGRGDCIGWWEPIGNGMMRCHGQFIRYRY